MAAVQPGIFDRVSPYLMRAVPHLPKVARAATLCFPAAPYGVPGPIELVGGVISRKTGLIECTISAIAYTARIGAPIELAIQSARTIKHSVTAAAALSQGAYAYAGNFALSAGRSSMRVWRAIAMTTPLLESLGFRIHRMVLVRSLMTTYSLATIGCSALGIVSAGMGLSRMSLFELSVEQIGNLDQWLMKSDEELQGDVDFPDSLRGFQQEVARFNRAEVRRDDDDDDDDNGAGSAAGGSAASVRFTQACWSIRQARVVKGPNHEKSQYVFAHLSPAGQAGFMDQWNKDHAGDVHDYVKNDIAAQKAAMWRGLCVRTAVTIGLSLILVTPYSFVASGVLIGANILDPEF